MDATSFRIGVIFGQIECMISFYKNTQHSILPQLLIMEQRLKQLKDEIESGVYSTPTEVYQLGVSFYAEVRQLRASCNTWKYTIVLEMYFNLSFQIKN